MSDEFADEILSDATERMQRAVAHARSEFAAIRTGRASPGLVEKLQVEYYGSTVPLQQLASFSVPDARMLMISPFDKSSMGAIERAIIDSNLGLNPSNDGAAIRLAFPQLTEERRRDYVRLAKQRAEESRNAIRTARRDARKDLEALGARETSPRTTCDATRTCSTSRPSPTRRTSTRRWSTRPTS
ncbi:MAG: ribosome recycling factor [Microthrixaceae bacterium]